MPPKACVECPFKEKLKIKAGEYKELRTPRQVDNTIEKLKKERKLRLIKIVGGRIESPMHEFWKLHFNAVLSPDAVILLEKSNPVKAKDLKRAGYEAVVVVDLAIVVYNSMTRPSRVPSMGRLWEEYNGTQVR